MALILDEHGTTGIVLNGMYFRIEKINFNEVDFQLVATGYASEEAFKSGAVPIVQPRAYTWGNYGKENMDAAFIFAYSLLKQHDDFKTATDHI